MSDYECREGHLMAPGDIRCPICGGMVMSEDGMSARQLARQEADEEREDE